MAGKHSAGRIVNVKPINATSSNTSHPRSEACNGSGGGRLGRFAARSGVARSIGRARPASLASPERAHPSGKDSRRTPADHATWGHDRPASYGRADGRARSRAPVDHALGSTDHFLTSASGSRKCRGPELLGARGRRASGRPGESAASAEGIAAKRKEEGHLSAAPFTFSDVASYGVSLLMRVDQLPRAARVPAAPGEGAHVPSLLSPVEAPKNRPPQVA